MKDDFYQNFERQLPWIPKLFFKLEKKFMSFDTRQPMTMMAELEREVTKVAERVQRRPRLALKAMMVLVNHKYFRRAMVSTMQICIRKVDKQLAADSRAAELSRLINMIDADVPFRSWLVLQEHVDLRILLRPICLAGTPMEDAKNLKGEAKATVLIDALGKTCEVLYKPYLMALWQLTCLARGEKPTRPGFGNLVIELSRRLTDFPGLVDPDARWMRNSARHERWEPIPNEDAIVMWDDHTPRTRVTLAELEKKVTELYQIAGVTFPSVAQRYLFREVLMETGMWSVLGRILPKMIDLAQIGGSTDADIDKLLEPELEPMKERFTTLIAFVASNYPSAVSKDTAASSK